MRGERFGVGDGQGQAEPVEPVNWNVLRHKHTLKRLAR